MNFKSLFFALSFLVLSLGTFSGFGQSITGFSPKFGSIGQNVRIDGSGFAGTTQVIFHNAKNAVFFVSSDTQINATVPSGTTTGPITVKKSSGQAQTVEDFTVIGPEPYVTDFSPISGSSGTMVTLNGVHFTGVTNTTFNGVKGTIAQLTSDTQIKIAAPANVTTGPITLTRSNLTFQTSSNFFVSPSITSFSPASGRSGTNVVLTGKNFLGTTFVKFNGVLAPSFAVDSNTQITTTVPTNVATGTINISTPGGQFFTTSNFVVQPTIFGFSPIFGKPGTNVTIVGVNLNGATAVKFNGTAASFSGDSTQIVATVPVQATSGPISITTTNGTVTTTTNFFLPVSIAGFTPTNGAPGTTVAIAGLNFTNATDVSFNGTSASFTVLNNISINAVVPANAMSGPISVTTPGGTTNTPNYFWIQPAVLGFSPARGVAGSSVTITGTSLTNASAVLFNGASTTNFTVLNNTQLTAIVPTNATTGLISVVAPGGTGVSAENFVIDTLTLSIKPLTNGPVVISWTTNAAGFSLQENTNLNALTNWVAVTNAPVLVGGKNTVTNAPTNSATFYRLKK